MEKLHFRFPRPLALPHTLSAAVDWAKTGSEEPEGGPKNGPESAERGAEGGAEGGAEEKGPADAKKIIVQNR